MATSKTDWDKVDALMDADIDTSDIPPITDDFFAKAVWRKPRQTKEKPVTEHQASKRLAGKSDQVSMG